MKLLNLTPHAINVLCADGSAAVIPSTAPPARCEESRADFGTTTDDAGRVIRIVKLWRGQVYDLPPVAPHTRYIVSALVALAKPGRDDLLVVDEIVRNDNGQVVGCRALAYLVVGS